jgi:hypothetical protein
MIALFTPQELQTSSVTGKTMGNEVKRPALNALKVDAIVGMYDVVDMDWVNISFCRS